MKNIPVITVDGPSGVGKGTLSLRLARKLDWNLLDSGAIYRALAVYAENQQVDFEDEKALAKLASSLPLTFIETQGTITIALNGEDFTDKIRLEQTGNNASIIAKHPIVRKNLLERQRAFAIAPGLIADGRDMGTEVFPAAKLKLFLTATSKVRAERRYKQLLDSGNCVKMEQILLEVEERDARDQARKVSPLIPADDAIVIDTSALTADEVMGKAWEAVIKYRIIGA